MQPGASGQSKGALQACYVMRSSVHVEDCSAWQLHGGEVTHTQQQNNQVRQESYKDCMRNACRMNRIDMCHAALRLIVELADSSTNAGQQP